MLFRQNSLISFLFVGVDATALSFGSVWHQHAFKITAFPVSCRLQRQVSIFRLFSFVSEGFELPRYLGFPISFPRLSPCQRSSLNLRRFTARSRAKQKSKARLILIKPLVQDLALAERHATSSNLTSKSNGVRHGHIGAPMCSRAALSCFHVTAALFGTGVICCLCFRRCS